MKQNAFFDKERRPLSTKEFRSSLEALYSALADMPQSSDLVNRWTQIYQKLKDDKHKVLFEQFCLEGASTFETEDNSISDMSDWLQLNQKHLLSIEKIAKARVLKEVMDISSYILLQQINRTDNAIIIQDKMKTSQATVARSMKLYFPALKLDTYFTEVEDIWHPKKKESVYRSSTPKKENAINKVFNDKKEEIEEIIKKHDRKIKDILAAFSRAFDYWTDYYIACTPDHTTKNGYTKEKRAPRSEESKERSRQAALKTRQCRKSKRK